MKWVWMGFGVLAGFVLAVLHKALIATWFPSFQTVTLETLDQLSQILLFVVALAALLYARRQVEAARQSNDQTRKLAQATFIFNLDQKWDGREMLEARRLFHKTRDDLAKIVASRYPMLDDDHKAIRLGEEFALTLSQMREQDQDNYSVIMRICGFFETVGLMVAAGYIPLYMIDDLLRGPILLLDHCFRKHIADMQNETGVPAGLYEHALALSDAVRSRAGP